MRCTSMFGHECLLCGDDLSRMRVAIEPEDASVRLEARVGDLGSRAERSGIVKGAVLRDSLGFGLFHGLAVVVLNDLS